MQQQGHEEDDEEEFALLDLDVLSGNFDIPPNAPYVLSVCGNFFFQTLIVRSQINNFCSFFEFVTLRLAYKGFIF